MGYQNKNYEKFSRRSVPLILPILVLTLVATEHPVLAQGGSAQAAGGTGGLASYENPSFLRQTVTINVGIRDARGFPLDEKATVRISSVIRAVNQSLTTEPNSSVTFPNLLEGPYEVEIRCPGYRPVVQHLDVSGGLAFFSTYIYMHPENEAVPAGGPAKGLVLTPKLALEIDKGLSAMQKHQYDSAKEHFGKAGKLVPQSSDVAFLMGTANQASGQSAAARRDFERSITLDPSNDRALLALGEMQLRAGDATGAIETLNKAYAANGAGWRIRYLLATAYAKAGKLGDAEMQARSAVRLAQKDEAPLLLLGEIQATSGKFAEAKQSWNRIVGECPNCPEAAEARKKISEVATETGKAGSNRAGNFSSSTMPELAAVLEERPWAPPDIDSREYSVAPDVSCNADEVITRAMRRTKSQLENLEKFGATEHIEHQEIDKRGVPGPLLSHNFYYLVFVYPYQSDSVFLQENRNGRAGVADFPTSLATTGLNSLGINILQPSYRSGFNYQCEGLSSVRGEAAWQVRFEEKKDSQLDVRRWQRGGTIYNIPLKGRIWLSSTSYDLLRIETDLREPVVKLELTRDHLQVDYGPVNFKEGKTTMWLPWSAEMYLELHGKRYHHKHFLSDYLLFGVDTVHRIDGPKNMPPPETTQEDPAPAPNVMGFSHEATTHHFHLLKDGGEIIVTANDPNDKASIEQIRTHLSHIVVMFSSGNFNAPMLIHDTNPPGAATMTRLKSDIRYTIFELPQGAKIRIETSSPETTDAVHAFLLFQIVDHKTGDAPTIGS